MFKRSQKDDVRIFYMGYSPFSFLLYPVYAFLIEDTLIDTGTIRCHQPFIQSLLPMKIKKIVNTHHHEDHVGNNADIQRMFDIPIYAHRLALPYLENPRLIDLHLYQKVIWGRPKASRGTAIGKAVHAGRYTLEVIHAPGHTEDHICLYEPANKWLFTGDLFCGTNFLYLREDENYLKMLDSLKRLSALDVKTLFCNLKGVVENGKDALLKKIKRMEILCDHVFRLKNEGWSPQCIRLKVLGREDARYFITRGHYSKQNTIDSILSDQSLQKSRRTFKYTPASSFLLATRVIYIMPQSDP